MIDPSADSILVDEDDDESGLEPATPAHRWSVPEEAIGQRLDKALAAAVPVLSRARLQALLDQGWIRLNGVAVAAADYRVRRGQTFDVFVPDPEPALPEPQAIALDIIYEDEALLVINKPAGMVVHPAPGHGDGTLVNALLWHCRGALSGIGGVRRPGIVHRLDKETSGLIVVAKTDSSHVGLSRQFGDRTIGRTYVCVVWGVPSPLGGEIDRRIGRSPIDRKRMAVVTGGGKAALTRYRVDQVYGTVAARVQCRLATGRTHQIRVHLASIGYPVVGDPVYGRAMPQTRLRQIGEPARNALTGFSRQALHAEAVEFLHPNSGKMMRFEVALPADLAELIGSLERI